MANEGPHTAELIEQLGLDDEKLRVLDQQIDAAKRLADTLQDWGIEDVTRTDVLEALSSTGLFLVPDVDDANPARNAYLVLQARTADVRGARN